MLAACSASQDTHCECGEGFFLWRGSTFEGLCAPCSTCERGQGVTRECGVKGNTECQLCGPGTFSEEQSTTKPCHPCLRCSDSEVEIRACQRNSDTICMGKSERERGWRRRVAEKGCGVFRKGFREKVAETCSDDKRDGEAEEKGRGLERVRDWTYGQHLQPPFI